MFVAFDEMALAAVMVVGVRMSKDGSYGPGWADGVGIGIDILSFFLDDI